MDRLVYGAIFWFSRLKEQRCFASNELLANVINSRPRTVQFGLSRLEKNGYIKRDFFDSRKRQRKEIIPLIDIRSTAHSPRIIEHAPVSTDEHQNKNIKENNKKLSKAEFFDFLKKGPEEEFYLKDFKMLVESCNNRGVFILGVYAKKRPLYLETKAQWLSYSKANIKSAQELEVYNDSQLKDVIKQIIHAEEYKGIDWSISTILKYLHK